MYIRIGCLCVCGACALLGWLGAVATGGWGRAPSGLLCVPEPAPCFGQVRGWKGRLRGAELQGRETFPGGERGS